LTTSPKIFQQLNFVLQFCPTEPSEQALMARFAKLDIGAGKAFAWDAFSPEIQRPSVRASPTPYQLSISPTLTYRKRRNP
jgi:hypothetical protein